MGHRERHPRAPGLAPVGLSIAPGIDRADDDGVLSHEQLCRQCTAWLLNLNGIELATWELAATLEVPAPASTIAGQLARRRSAVLDAVGITDPWMQKWRSALRSDEANAKWAASSGYTPQPRAGKRPRRRVVVVEAKVSRPDLVADLRAQKMIGYQSIATECYLALGPRVFPDWPTQQVLGELERLGLPRSWGLLRTDGRCVGSVRNAKRQPVVPTRATMEAWTWSIAKSVAWRRLRDA